MRFTKYTSATPLSKQYHLDENGEIKKQPHGNMFAGTAERVDLPFKEFTKVLMTAGPNQAIGYGTYDPTLPDKVPIVMRGKEQPGQISRTTDYLKYREEPGVMMFDHDPSEYGPPFTLEQVINVLGAVHPELAQAARIVRGSVSAGVHKTGEPPQTGKGFHIYVEVANAADIPRYGQALVDRLWLAGHGYIALAANGAMLERTLIDGAVFSPERLDFVGPPIVGEGLAYTPQPAIYTPGTVLDTQTLQDLTADEQATVAHYKTVLKQVIKPQAAAKQDEWAVDRVAAGTSQEDIDRIINSGFSGLWGEFPLVLSDGRTVTVDEIVARPEQYNGQACADPLEGPDYGRTTAMIFCNDDGSVIINSHAHGRCTYFLHKNAFAGNSIGAPPPPLNNATAALLACITKVDFKTVCSGLGWRGRPQDHPQQKHLKVAIIDVLIKTAKANNWRIAHNAGFFYIYNGAYWVVLLDAEVKLLLKDAAVEMGYAEIESRNSKFVDELFKQAQQDGFFVEKNFIKQSIINLKNGSLVLSESGVTLKPFDDRDFLTHQLDFNHDPNAVNNLFLIYLEQILPNADTRRTLQQVAGYLFVRGLKMEKIFFLFGIGSNGKSVFFEVLNGVIGTENISNYSLESLTDDKGYHRAMIKDKIVNYGTDIKLNRIDAGMFKTLASGEPIEARLPYRDPFMMTDYAKLIFNVNSMASANIEHTHGFYRRLLIIPFNVLIRDEQQDRDLHKKILQDRPGVLNWIIEGAEAVIKNRDIFISSECDDFKKKFLKESDSVAMFVDSLGEPLAGQKYSQSVTFSYLQYQTFCREAGHKYPVGRNTFTERMLSLGFNKIKKEYGWMLEKCFVSHLSGFCQGFVSH